MPWAKRWVVEREGSELAGSLMLPPLTGRQAAPPPTVEATRVGTAMRQLAHGKLG